MELAALRTRRPKRDAKLSELSKRWQAEAKALGFELSQNQQQARTDLPTAGRSLSTPSVEGFNTASSSPPASSQMPVNVAASDAAQSPAAQLGSLLGQAMRGLDQPARMSGLRIKLRYREHEQE
jgi:hypothetical protein